MEKMKNTLAAVTFNETRIELPPFLPTQRKQAKLF